MKTSPLSQQAADACASQSQTPSSSCHPSRPRPGKDRWPNADQSTRRADLRFNPRTLAQGALSHLPALKLEDPLGVVHVHAQQRSHGAVAERLAASIISSIGSSSSDLTLAARFVGLQYVVRRATPNHWHSFVIGTVTSSSFRPCWTESISSRPIPAGRPPFPVRGSPRWPRPRLPAGP